MRTARRPQELFRESYLGYTAIITGRGITQCGVVKNPSLRIINDETLSLVGTAELLASESVRVSVLRRRWANFKLSLVSDTSAVSKEQVPCL